MVRRDRTRDVCLATMEAEGGRTDRLTLFLRRVSSLVKILLRVFSEDISAMERSLRARSGASGPHTCRLSGDDASGRWPYGSADLGCRVGSPLR